MCKEATEETSNAGGTHGNQNHAAPNVQESSRGSDFPNDILSINKSAAALVPGLSPEGNPINRSLRPQQSNNEDPILIGIRGKWYDVTKFLPHHPGGDILLDFAGRDATAQFLAYHDPIKVLKYRKPVGTYPFNEECPGGDKMEGDWMKLYEKYEKKGYCRTPVPFIISRMVIVFGFLLFSLLCIWKYLESGSKVIFVVGAVSMAGFWQQSGFIVHDTMHNILFHDRKLDQSIGWVFGNVFMGLSSKWWRDEHNEHHLFTNTAVQGVGIADPQMVDDVWVQDLMMSPFIYDTLPQVMKKIVSRYQHLYFVPLCVVAGPFTIKAVSLANERRTSELFGIALYWIWVLALFSTFPSWAEAAVFYAIGNVCLGILSVQLLVSHYSKPWAEKESVKSTGAWAKRQVESVVDISCPTYMDWFHGGLHLHSPHHLFPRINRCYYREVQRDVIEMCTENGVTLDVMPWFDAVAATIEHLRLVGKQLEARGVKKTM